MTSCAYILRRRKIMNSRPRRNDVVVLQQIAGAAEPGEKRRHGAEIEPRRAVLPAAMAVYVPQMNAVIEMQVGYMQVYAAAQERQRAHGSEEHTSELQSLR